MTKSLRKNVPDMGIEFGWANSVDPDQTALWEQSDQGLHCLLFHLHLLDKLLYGKTALFKFRMIIVMFISFQTDRSGQTV